MMCSVDESDAGGELALVKEPVNVLDASCRKCTTKATVLLQGKFPYCRNCFVLYFKHKFFSTIGKSKLMKPDDCVLLAFSGSPSTTSLLHLMKCGQSEERRKKVFSSAKALFIDEGVSAGLSPEDRLVYLNQIKRVFSEYSFPAFIALFELDQVRLFPIDELVEILPHMTEVDLKTLPLFSKLHDSTNKEDFLRHARRRILYSAAEKLGCNKIFTGETCDHMAINILTNVALGRGGQIGSDVGFCDDRCVDACILRPLRECSRKEVTYYNFYNGLEPVVVPKIGLLETQFSSIRKLTESFINGLQVEFPSTVSTIVGSGNKLASHPSSSQMTCALCRGSLGVSSGELNAEESVKISSMVSQLGPKGLDPVTLKPLCNGTEGCGSSKGGCCKSSIKPDPTQQPICYGCRLILAKVPKENWTDYLHPDLVKEHALEKMREEIQDFLL